MTGKKIRYALVSCDYPVPKAALRVNNTSLILIGFSNTSKIILSQKHERLHAFARKEHFPYWIKVVIYVKDIKFPKVTFLCQ